MAKSTTIQTIASLCLLMFTFYGSAQNKSVIEQPLSIRGDGIVADSSAMFEVQSDAKGVLISRMSSAQRTAIPVPATGLLVYDTDQNAFYFFDGGQWTAMAIESTPIWNLQDTNAYYTQGRVGIGTNNPMARLDVRSGSVLFAGEAGQTPIQGEGTRLMWVAEKAAFRSGRLEGPDTSNWDADSIGMYSLAGGFGTRATGASAFAFGHQSRALDSFTTAIGSGNEAAGMYSFALGQNALAAGQNSMSLGLGTFTPSFGEIAMGLYNTSYNPVSSGSFNEQDRLFSLGNGTSAGSRSNALTVLKNGYVGICEDLPLAKLQVRDGSVLFNGTTGGVPVSGPGHRLMWVAQKAAFRAGYLPSNAQDSSNWDADSIGMYSIAAGFAVKASGQSAVSLGEGSYATGQNSTALGVWTTASGDTATALGNGAVASGNHALSAGRHTIAPSYGEVALGYYNSNYSSSSATEAILTDRLFSIGNGPSAANRSNAVTILKDGKVGIGEDQPLSLLQVRGGSVMFNGTLGTVPLTGDGTRLMWVPGLSALRAGTLTGPNGTFWDPDSIGMHSVALGLDPRATGPSSVAIGRDVRAAGMNASSIGFNSKASGDYSSAIGRANEATGNNSVAIGYSNSASGTSAVALGFSGDASGNYSLVMGNSSNAGGLNSTAFGFGNQSTGNYSTSWGFLSTAAGDYSTAFGDSCLAIGPLSIAMGNSTVAQGFGSIAMGDTTKAIGPVSTATGLGSQAAGFVSTAMGHWTRAPSYGELAVGVYNTTYTPEDEFFHNPADRIFSVGIGTSDMDRSNALTVLKSGYVGIGIDTPGHLLELVMDDAVKPGGGSWSAPSDRRLKRDIRDYTDGLSVLLQINPVFFYYNNKSSYDTSQEHIGVIAQELEIVAPYMVDRYKKGEDEFLSVDNTAMTYMLINAVKEQQKIIESLKNTVESQDRELREKTRELSKMQEDIVEIISRINRLESN